MFRLIPATIQDDGRKVPLLKGWQFQASSDPEQFKLWQDLYREKLKYFAIPTGKTNNILVLDVDAKSGGLDSLPTLQLPHTLWQKTLSGGFHFIFRLPNDGHVYGNRVNFMKPDRPGLDIRGEGGYIMYYGFADNTAIADAPPWLLEAARKSEAPVGNSSITVDPTITAEVVTRALDAIREAPEGESNNTLNMEAFRLGQLISAGSLTKEYAHAALTRAALDRGKPTYETKATIDSGIAGGMKHPLVTPFEARPPTTRLTIPAAPAPPARWTPPNFTYEDITNVHFLRRPQLFKDWSTEDIHITTADGGTGKTTLKLYEAVCLALGDRFLGFECLQPGAKTLYITGEDTDKKLGAIIGQILRHMGLLENFPGFREKVEIVLKSIVVKKDADLCLITRERNGFISPSAEAMRRVMEAVDDVKPKLIVLDPISSFWGSEAALNDMNKAVTKWASELAERSGACVEMINHMGKQSSATQDMTQFAGRGGSGLPSNARVSRVFRTISDAEFTELTGETLNDGQSAMMCMVNKFTDGSPLYNKPFLVIRDGFRFTRKALTEAKAKEAEQKLSDQVRVFEFVKEERLAQRFPTRPVVVAFFMQHDSPLSEARTKRALAMVEYQGHMGEKIKRIENPDQTSKDEVYVITDMTGVER